jgi:asparagine synthase (glutamine-hydrolysing)
MDALSEYSDVLSRLGEPFADQSLLPRYLVARETSQEAKVALSGDGADELFGGYDRYRAESLSKYYRALPEPVRERFIEPLANRVPAPSGTRAGDLAFKGQWFLNRSGSASVPDRHFEMLRIFDGSAAAAYDAVDPVESGKRALETRHRRLPDELRRRDDLARIQAVDPAYSLPNQLLHKVDLASTYNSLEVRVPFIDTAVVEYVMSLPTRYKITDRERRRVLKRAFDDVLPAVIFERPKHGFDTPISEWFRGELAEEFRELVAAVDTGVLDDDAVRRIHDEHVGGRRDHGKFLWSVFVFKHWGRRMQETGVL